MARRRNGDHAAVGDAFRSFRGTGIEVRAIGNCLVRKEAQDPKLKLDYRDRFELD